MATLEKETDKIQKICDKLRKETLEPAEKEAERIIEEARQRGKEIIHEAEKKGKELIDQAHKQTEQQRSVFHSSLNQAARQVLEQLRQEIEHKLFHPELEKHVAEVTSKPEPIAKLVQAIIESIKTNGHEADLAIYIPASVSPQEITRYLSKEVLQKLSEKPFELGTFQGGAKVKLKDRKMTIDMSDEAINEWITRYIQKDLRKFVFQ